MIKEFRDFLLRGNIIELAVAFVIGAAFALVVKSFNDNIITPIIAMLGGKPDFSDLYFTINGAQFRWGAFLTDLLGFVITAAAIFFLVVKPVNTINARRARGEEPSVVEPTEEILLLREIRDSLQARG
jgi:large conductance mechanosensitive channel